jgi:hypothetical protein
MAYVLAQGISLIVRPSQGWAEIRESSTPATGLLMAYGLVFALLPFLGRSMGHLALDWPAANLLLDALLYPAFCLGLVLALGLVLGAVAPRIDGVDDRTAAVYLAFYASTPLWVLGLLHAIPSVGVHSLLTAGGVGWCGWLFALGAHDVLDLPPDKGLVAVGLLFAGFTFAFVLLTQVLLIHLLSGP